MNVDLDHLEAAAKAATPGRWGHYGHRPHINVPDEVRAEDGTVIVTVHNDCDAAFIAAVNPAVVLELIAELRKTQKERDYLAAWLADVGKLHGPDTMSAKEFVKYASKAVEENNDHVK